MSNHKLSPVEIDLLNAEKIDIDAICNVYGFNKEYLFKPIERASLPNSVRRINRVLFSINILGLTFSITK